MQVPVPGTTTQVITDTDGGWIYTITTNVSVSKRAISSLQGEIDEKKSRVAEIQKEIADTEALISSLGPVPPVA